MKVKYLLLGLLLGLCSCQNNQMSSPSTNSSSFNSSDSEQVMDFAIVGPTKVVVGDVVKYSVDPLCDVTFASSDDLILSINSKGEATTFKEGNVTITATSKKDATKVASLAVVVGKDVQLPTNYLEVNALLEQAKSLEVAAKEIEVIETDTSIDETKTIHTKMYDNNFYIEELDDHYTNFRGETHEIATTFTGIYQDYYYQVHDCNTASYATKRKIVSENVTDYEILESEAISKGNVTTYVSTFVYELSSLWSARTLDLKIEGEVTEAGINLKLSNIYLFKWADGIGNDSAYMEATLEFDLDGFLLHGSFLNKTYEESQYDVSTNDFVADAQVKRVETIEISLVKGLKYLSSEANFDPREYLVSEVTLAKYMVEVHSEDYLLVDNIKLIEYQGPKAIDVDDIRIVGLQSVDDVAVVIYDEYGRYVAIQPGTTYLLCQMMYSSDVMFLVEIVVID